MAIIGFDDTLRLRRNGKIRAGYKDEKSNKPVNTDFFMLHDAPGVAASIGDKPTEIFFTVYTDNIDDICYTDLRWYNTSQLMCRSMHGAPDADGVDMGAVAAFKGVGVDVKGLQQRPFPRVDEARVRTCAYKACPEYIKGLCGEHMFLNFMIPQHSMAELFTLDSVSVNAILNAKDVLYKSMLRNSRISGQIFKMYKAPGEISYQKKDGSKGKAEAQMVYFSNVDFNEYENRFKSQIKPEDWEALMNIRSPHYALGASRQVAAPPMRDELTGSRQAQLESTSVLSTKLIDNSDEEQLKLKAMDPVLTPYFDELGRLLGKEPTEKIRMATMREIPTVEAGVLYLKNKIKEQKKKQGKEVTTEPTPEVPPQEETPVEPPPPVEGGTSLY